MNNYVPLTSSDIDLATRLFKQVIVPVATYEHAREDGRAGAVLDIRDHRNFNLLHVRAGEATEEQFQRYRQNAAAKNQSLEDHPKIRSSWMVHNIKSGLYPGGIRTRFDDRFAISGFTWQRDQAGSLWLAQQLGRIDHHNAQLIAELSGESESHKRLVAKFDRHRNILDNTAAA